MMAVFRIFLSNAFYGFSDFAEEVTPSGRAKAIKEVTPSGRARASKEVTPSSRAKASKEPVTSSSRANAVRPRDLLQFL